MREETELEKQSRKERARKDFETRLRLKILPERGLLREEMELEKQSRKERARKDFETRLRLKILPEQGALERRDGTGIERIEFYVRQKQQTC